MLSVNTNALRESFLAKAANENRCYNSILQPVDENLFKSTYPKETY